MRNFFAICLIVAAAFSASAAVAENATAQSARPRIGDVTWFPAEAQDARVTVIHLLAPTTSSGPLGSEMRSPDWNYGAWTMSPSDQVDEGGLRRHVANGELRVGLDASRLVLIADAKRAQAAIGLANESQRRHNGLRLRGVVVEIDEHVEWAQLDTGSAPWPPLLISYAATRRDAREAAFELARRARRAGAAVQLLPHAQSDVARSLLATTQAWVAALELPRVARFEDAIVSRDSRRDQARLAQKLESLLSARNGAEGTVARTGGVDVGGSRSLFVDADGRIEIEDAGQRRSLEFDAPAALQALFGEAVAPVRVSMAAASWISHPETAETMLAIPTQIAVDGSSRSLLLLRRSDASYAYIDLADSRAVEVVQASPESTARGRSLSLLMASSDERASRLMRVDLQQTSPRRGVWWDPSRPGHGIDLQPVEGGHSLVFATFDDAGDSRWYLATGHIAQNRFTASDEGLMLMRRRDPMRAPAADPQARGFVSIDFAIDASHPACRARAADATQLALFQVTRGGRSESWCIEPYPLTAGVPEVDVNGTWYGGRNDSGWGLSIFHGGGGEHSVISALLYFHDADGWPRWAMGGGLGATHGAALTMFDYRLDCAACARPKTLARPLGDLTLRAAGWCGAPELRASAALVAPQSGIDFQREEVELNLVSQRRCY